MSEKTEASVPPVVDQPVWWRLPIVWMVIGGPAAVVVASLFTVFLAVKNVDPVIEVPKAQNNPVMTPAVQGRNHAAQTGNRSPEN